jgi:hypothetical protein
MVAADATGEPLPAAKVDRDFSKDLNEPGENGCGAIAETAMVISRQGAGAASAQKRFQLNDDSKGLPAMP